MTASRSRPVQRLLGELFDGEWYPRPVLIVKAWVALAVVSACLISLGHAAVDRPGAVIALAYLTSFSLLLLLILPSFVVAGWLFARSRALLGCAILAVLLLPLADPYASGRIGGDANATPVYEWQIWITRICAGLLIAAAVLLRTRHVSLTWWLIASEALVFSVANIVYTSRDGSMRFYDGYDWYPTPLVAVCMGLLLRVLMLALVRRPR